MNTIVYSKEELKRIQTLECEALKMIHEVCEKEGIEYFLIGGTALGALRHSGFIPWDDDIDIGMTRDNYLKFIEKGEQVLPEGYFLQTPYKTDRNPYYYTKVRIDGTKFIEYCNHRLDMHHGVYVDIFPFDEVPNDEKENIKQFRQIQRLIRIFQIRQSPDANSKPNSVKGVIKSMVRKPLHYLTKLIPYSFIDQMLDHMFTKYNGTKQDALACLNFPKRKVEYITKANLYPLQLHEFEDMMAYIPHNIDAYLTTHFGDYMKLPPMEERFGHKPYLVDLGEEK